MQNLKKAIIDNELIRYAINNDLHIECFIWSHLRALHVSGFISRENVESTCSFINKRLLKSKLKTNIFFSVNEDGAVKINNRNTISVRNGRRGFKFSHKDFSNFVIKDKTEPSWSSTNIKYFLISVFACQHENQKPYALELISSDLGVPATTIQRALKFFDIIKYFEVSEKESMRSYYIGLKKKINFTPNFYIMPAGHFFEF